MSKKNPDRVNLKAIAHAAGITEAQVDTLVDGILAALRADREVRIDRLGRLYMVHLGPRRFATPIAPGGEMNLPAHRQLRFTRFRSANAEIKDQPCTPTANDTSP